MSNIHKPYFSHVKVTDFGKHMEWEFSEKLTPKFRKPPWQNINSLGHFCMTILRFQHQNQS